jgi:hypothetical protein
MIVINTAEVSTFDTSAVWMTIIMLIPLLYWWLSSCRYLCCIDDNHKAEVSTWWLSSIQQRYRHDDSQKYSRGIDMMIVINNLCCIYDYHHVDTSAVFLTIIKSIPLLYWWLSSSRYHCCIDAYYQIDTCTDSDQNSRGIDLIIGINTVEVSTWW